MTDGGQSGGFVTKDAPVTGQGTWQRRVLGKGRLGASSLEPQDVSGDKTRRKREKPISFVDKQVPNG
jgi:hypothetical protein